MAQFELTKINSNATVTGLDSFTTYANLSFGSSIEEVDIERCITNYGLSANQNNINNRYKDYYICSNNTPAFSGFLNSDLSTSSYPWMGFNTYKIDNSSPKFILNGTTPLMGTTVASCNY